MSDKPLVSILMTAYNREKYIKEAIESVLASSYTDFELIICDDRSTDNTVSIAREYVALDRRVKLFINEANLGDYFNRNKAASHALGKYIKYLDSDDTIYPYSLQIMVEEMEKFPDVSFAFNANEIQDPEMAYPVLYTSRQAYMTHYFSIGGLFYAGPGGTIIRKSSFDKIGPFSGKRFISDGEMWMKFALHGPILKIQPGLIWWRVHAGQEFTAGTSEYALLRYNLDKEMLNHPVCPLTEKEKKMALGNNRRILSRKILGLLFWHLNFLAAFQLAKNAGIGPLQLLESMLPVNKMKKAHRTFIQKIK
ncbi:MAG TPA: glycosyltransferase family A protein [Puia sp.]|nr:glycosyltransferase family A protein [Puia sp.]